jgi:hypothetical protein
MSFLRLDIQKDGLTYCIEADTVNEVKIEGLLRENCDGWMLVECTRNVPSVFQGRWNIGRRKSWTKALAEALELLEKTADSR